MRPDVKLGIVSSMMIILVAGGYYFYRDGNDGAIPVSSDAIATGKKVSPGKRASSKTNQPKTKANGKRTTPANVDRSADKLATKKPTTNPRVANNNKRHASPASGRAPHKVTVPVVNKATQQNKPIATNPVARDKRPVANRLASNQSKKIDPRHPVTNAITKSPSPVKVTSPAGSDDEAVERHRVQPGDTMASLAVNYYGDEKYTRFLIDNNAQLANPLQLGVGTMVLIPARPTDHTLLAATRRSTPAVAKAAPNAVAAKKSQARMYTVKSGDSFYSIARDELGDAAQWQKLFELNKAVVKGDARKLQIGQVIQLPG